MESMDQFKTYVPKLDKQIRVLSDIVGMLNRNRKYPLDGLRAAYLLDNQLATIRQMLVTEALEQDCSQHDLAAAIGWYESRDDQIRLPRQLRQ